MPGVGGRVGEHLVRERAGGPVGALVLLVEGHAEVLLEQCREADPRLVEKLGGDPGVEEPRGANAVLPLEEAQVIVGVVEDDFDPRVGQQRGKSLEALDGQRIHDGGALSRGDLQEIHPVLVAVEAGGLGVHGEQRFAGQVEPRRRSKAAWSATTSMSVEDSGTMPGRADASGWADMSE